MAQDELNAPLGQDKPKPPRRFPIAAPQLVAGILGLFGLSVLAWAAFVNDPLGGEPVAAVAVSKPITAGAPAGDAKAYSRHDGIASTGPDAAAAPVPPAKTETLPSGSKTITIIDGSNGKRQDVVIPGSATDAGDSGAAKPVLDPKLLETSRHGAIPKIGPNGERASMLYASARDIPQAKRELPRIAIVIGGIGISASGTADAFAKLPPAVTFALTPYGADLVKLAARARDERHEVLLQLPMEPFDYPDNDPGPQTLLTSLSSEQNIDRLHWLMSRFQGYVGVESYMGGRFTSSEQSLAPVLRDAAKRGLIYVDDGASARSVASQVAGGNNVPFARGDVVLDAVPTPVEIDRALARLEIVARDNGMAVGLAAALPATVARIAEWAKKVEARGFVLVPISMVALKAKAS